MTISHYMHRRQAVAVVAKTFDGDRFQKTKFLAISAAESTMQASLGKTQQSAPHSRDASLPRPCVRPVWCIDRID